ncbi:IclR family transcriptional regulator C-terminal domain-containing protein, partial [Neisseria sp. HMSC066B07]
QLLAIGFLARDVDERSFTTGPALRRLAIDTLNHGVVRGLRHEVLSALVRQVGETCNLTTLDGAQVLYLDRVEAQWPLRLTLDVGSHVPLHCTASGKLFLSQMPAKARDAFIGGLPLERMTPNTITSADA